MLHGEILHFFSFLIDEPAWDEMRPPPPPSGMEHEETNFGGLSVSEDSGCFGLRWN